MLGRSGAVALLLPNGCEECRELLRAGLGLDAGAELEAMVEPAILADRIEAANRTGLWVITAIHDARHASVHQRTGAHRTRLQGHVASDVEQPPAAARRGCG